MGTAGPQPRLPGCSGHCRTSTATSRSQWALPDLNRDFQIPVGTAGPQRPDRMPEDMPNRMPEDMSEDMPEHMPEDMPEHMPEDMPDRMPEDMSDRMPEDLPDRMPKDMPEHMPEDMPDRMPDRMPEDMSDRMPEDMSDRMPEDLPDRMPEDMPEDMPEHMPGDMSDRMPEDLPVRKCINAMVEIIRSEVIYLIYSTIAYYYTYIYIYTWIRTLSKKVLNPPNHAPVPLPKKVFGSIGIIYHHHFFIGKSTINGPFSIYFCMFTRGYIYIYIPIGSMYGIYGNMDPINIPQSC